VTSGIEAILDKSTGKNWSFSHGLMQYDSAINDAYDFKPTSAAFSVREGTSKPPTGAAQCFNVACEPAAVASTATEQCSFTLRSQSSCVDSVRRQCLGWKQTGGCDALGTREPAHDKDCAAEISPSASGFCSCEGNRSYPVSCDASGQRATFTCAALCGTAAAAPVQPLLASSVSLGPIMHEVRLQESIEHKTRLRLWLSDDPELGGRLEIAHHVGVLTQKTEVLARFTVPELQHATFYSEDNGYEKISHVSGAAATVSDIPLHTYPSQMSTWLVDERRDLQLSVALGRSHGVASLINGTLDVMQHRRGAPFAGSGGTVVIDDADRTFSEAWVALGNVSRSNAMRHANKLRLNHPLLLFFDMTNGTHQTPAAAQQPASMPSLPTSLLLQNVRATAADRAEILMTLLHVYGRDERPAAASQPAAVDLNEIMTPFRPDLTSYTETILNGLIPKANLTRLRWEADATREGHGRTAHSAKTTEATALPHVTMQPFEIRSFLVRKP